MQPFVYYRLHLDDPDGTLGCLRVRAIRLGRGPLRPTTLAVWPNPARRDCTVHGAGAGATVRVFDGRGRAVAAATANARGTARVVLPAGLPAGEYVVQCGGQTRRLAVE